MNKKLIAAFIALTLIAPTTANANNKIVLKSTSLPTPTIAIVDMAIDMSQQKFKDSVVHEVCLIEVVLESTSRCPNGLTKMEGPGAASLPIANLAQGGFEHGTWMADVALQANPNVKIIFIRIIGQRQDGTRELLTNEATVFNALQWVIDNSSRFNIKAVAMPQASHASLGAAGTDYCLKTPTTSQKITTLKQNGIGSFFSAGNNKDSKRVSWPSCIPDSIATSAVLPDGQTFASYSNYDKNLTDFFAIGSLTVTGLNQKKTLFAGTSASAVAAAVAWATVSSKKNTTSYSEIYSALFNTATVFQSNRVGISNGRAINLKAILNG